MAIQSCYYCGYVSSGLTRDHLIPRVNGGTDEPENIVPCCLRCNTLKGTRSAEEFSASMASSPLFQRVRAEEDQRAAAILASGLSLKSATLAQIGQSIGPFGVAIYAMLVALADERGRVTLGQRVLGRSVGIGRTSAYKVIRELRDAGFVDFALMNQPDDSLTSIFELRIA